MRAHRYSFAALALMVSPGFLFAQLRSDGVWTRPLNGGYPPVVSAEPRPPMLSWPSPAPGEPIRSFEQWATIMETGVRDPFKRTYDLKEQARDFNLARVDRLYRPAWVEPERRAIIERELTRIKEQEHELRSLRNLYEFRLRELPEPSPDRR